MQGRHRVIKCLPSVLRGTQKLLVAISVLELLQGYHVLVSQPSAFQDQSEA